MDVPVLRDVKEGQGKDFYEMVVMDGRQLWNIVQQKKRENEIMVTKNRMGFLPGSMKERARLGIDCVIWRNK